MPVDDVLPEEIPYPDEVLPRGRIDFGSVTPLPAGTMNAALELQSPNIRYSDPAQVQYSPSDRWLIQQNEDEHYAKLGINPVLARRARYDAEEQAMRTAGQLEYQQLVSGGTLPEEAYRRVAGKLNWNHPDKLALALDRLSLPGAIPGSINATPILGQDGARIGDAVYDAAGRLHSTKFNDPNKPTPDEIGQAKMDKEIRDSLQTRLNTLYRAQNAQGGLGGIINSNIATDIKDLEARLGAMRGTAAPASDERVPVVSKDGKKGTVPRSRLAEALRQGYKEI